MKKYFIAITIITTIITACNKNIYQTGIVGKWKLKESLQDPGDGSGQWTVPSEKIIIEFTSGGEIKYDGNKPSVKYKIVNDSTMEIKYPSAPLNITYKLDGNNLYMRPPCIEACGEKYTRLN